MWISDVHIDNVLWSDPSSADPADIVTHINNLNPAFTIDTGDLVDTSALANFQLYASYFNALINPYYPLLGNHDEADGGCVASPDTCLIPFVAVFDTIHPAPIVRDGYKFIFIAVKFAPPNKNRVDAAELAYLEGELQTAGSNIPVVFGHAPIGEITDGHDEFLALLATYNVKAYFSGHMHTPLSSTLVDGTYHVNGDQVFPISPFNCGMMVCDVLATGIQIYYIRSAAPWDLYYSLWVPCGE